MKVLICLSVGLLLLSQLKSQNSRKISVEASYGLNGNFFVGSYDESGGPPNSTYLYKKKFLGTIGGVELKFHLNEHSALIAGYSRTTNKGEKNYIENVNGVDLFINSFNLRHNNDFFQLAYERSFTKSSPAFSYHIGVVLATMQQQEISIDNFINQILIDERNYKNSKLQEAGVFAGIHWRKKIDTKFEAGIRVRGYYLISVQTFEALTITPTLTYRF